MNNGNKDTSNTDVQKLQEQLNDIKEQVCVNLWCLILYSAVHIEMVKGWVNSVTLAQPLAMFIRTRGESESPPLTPISDHVPRVPGPFKEYDLPLRTRDLPDVRG